MGHAGHVAHDRKDLRGGQQGVPVRKPRVELGDAELGSDEQREARHRDDGRRAATSGSPRTTDPGGRRHPFAEWQRAGVAYAGTDDGHLNVSRDGGRSWTDVADKIPGAKGIWVSEVVPSRFDEATAYATFDGHRRTTSKRMST
jgi:hypothetical protein